MKLGILISSLEGGGAEYVTRTWAAELIARGHEVCIFTYEPRDETKVPLGASHRQFPGCSASARATRLPAWVRREAERQGIDGLLSMLTYSNLVALAAFPSRRRRLPVIISERNLATTFLANEGPSGLAQRGLARRLYRFADAAIAISHPVAADLVGGFGVSPDRLWVVPNPVTSAGAKPVASRRVPSDQITIAFAGRLVRQKRPERVLETMLELNRRGVSCRAIVIGDGPLRASLEEHSSAEGLNCSFMGWLEDWRSGLTGADCFLLPSDMEGFGNVLVEATTLGIPVVASARALGIADAIVPGVTGIVAMSPSPVHLADAVVQASRLAPVRQPANWLSWFSVENSCDRLEEVLVNVGVGER